MRTVSGRRIKLFLSDLDGTLLNPFNRLNPDDVAAIRELRNDGIAFTFATGRSDSMCRCYAEALELDEAIASYNGAVIREGVAGKRVHVAYMDSDDVRRTLDFFLKQGIDFLFYDPESIYYQPGSRKIRDCQA